MCIDAKRKKRLAFYRKKSSTKAFHLKYNLASWLFVAWDKTCEKYWEMMNLVKEWRNSVNYFNLRVFFFMMEEIQLNLFVRLSCSVFILQNINTNFQRNYRYLCARISYDSFLPLSFTHSRNKKVRLFSFVWSIFHKILSLYHFRCLTTS